MSERIDSLEYLPEFYQSEQNDFLGRFLSIFTDMYSGLEQQIDSSSTLLSPDTCPDNFVPWLSEWIAVENLVLFPDSAKRSLLKLTPWLNQHRGTIDALKALLKLYCGAEPFVVERYHVERYIPTCPLLQQIYHGDKFTVWVLFPQSGPRTEVLDVLVRSQLPANIICRTKVLSQVAELDNYSYLGVNAVLSGARCAYLDGCSAVGYSVI